jgi:hypothetical protein
MRGLKITSWIFLLLLSCKSEQDKFVQAEFAKIQAQWQVVSFTVNGTNLPDSLRNKLRTGAILFQTCNYTPKAFSVPGRACGGDFEINDFIYGVSYRYDYDQQIYTLSLGIPFGMDNKPLQKGADKSVINLI